MKVIDIWADWCPPCKKFVPIFEAVSDEYPDIDFVKIDADKEENREFLIKHQIRGIPSLLILDDSGETLFQHAGVLGYAELKAVINTYYSNEG